MLNTQEISWNNVWSTDIKKNTYSHSDWRNERADDKIGYFLQKGVLFHQDELVLDAGCGDGSILFAIKKHFPVRPIGLDFSQKALDAVSKNIIEKNNHIETYKSDTREMPFGNSSIDKILSLGVIEHLLDSQSAVDELARCLKKNGLLILMTPNKKSFGRIDRIMKMLFGCWKFGLQKEFDVDELEQMVEKSGLKVVKKETVIRKRFKNDSFAFRIIYAMDSFFSVFSDKWGFYSYVFATK